MPSIQAQNSGYKRDPEEVDEESPCNSRSIENGYDFGVLEMMPVAPDEDEHADACSYEEPGHHLSRREQPFEIELCDNYGSGTVRDESDQASEKNSENRYACKERSDRALSDEADQQTYHKRYNENEYCYLEGVDQC